MWKAAAVGLLLPVLGCGSKVSVEKTRDLQASQTWTLEVEAPKKDQRVRVDVTARSGPVHAVVLLAKDLESIEKDLDKAGGKLPATALGGELDKQSATIEVNIPAGEKFAVFVQSLQKDTSVTVKINSL